MRIIFLNAWNGQQASEIRSFLAGQAPVTDVFCFQEAYDDFRSIAAEFLHDFTELQAYALAFEDPVTGTEDFALATYVRKSLQLTASDTLMSESRVRGLGIHVALTSQNGPLHIVNYHGISVPDDKLDTPDRLDQSRMLVQYLANLNGPCVLGGDFNLIPNTEAYRMIKDAGFKELIVGHKIETTRNHLYWDRGVQRLAYSDYIFVSEAVTINSFTVPQLEISDHLPLLLEVDLHS